MDMVKSLLNKRIFLSLKRCHTLHAMSSKLSRISEIQSCPSEFVNRSVRTWGRVISHDIFEQEAIIINDDGQQLLVNTKMIEPYGFTLRFYYTFIGDILKKNETDITLCARNVSCVNTLDINLFERTLDLRREYLDEKT